ncbi:hypothetical protein [Salinispora pacifica]|uniref:hypothetical protein n=1 Tax=Salinispora pacifica TaxID=351187 RepID=UPI00037407EE|nr:hypothetical protein [Salinispora pacifica]
MLTPLHEQVRERARRDAALVDLGRELTDVRKRCNTALNRPRAAVECAIAHLKSSERASGGLEEFPAALRTVTKLETFRVYGPS